MAEPPPPQKDSLQDWLKAIAIWSFLSFWLWGIVGSFTNGMCRDLDRPAAERLRLCERGDWMMGWSLTKIQEAELMRVRGIALAELGRQEEATDLFRRSFGPNPQSVETLSSAQLEAMREMMAADVPEAARKLWHKTLSLD